MSKKAIDKIRECADIDVPHSVWTLFGHQQKCISIAAESACLGEDYASLDEIREALEWYVDQFGGKVKWSKK